MALPQRRDAFDDQRRQAEEMDRRRIAAENAGTAWFAWWWIWLLIIIAIIWFAGWGWGGYGGWWWGGARGVAVQNVNQANPAQITGRGVAVLNATDKQAFVGQPFRVSNVPVQNKINNQVLWIGANNNSGLLVVLTGTDNSAANAGIQQGTRVNVTGTVEKAPPAAQARQQWSLSNQDAN